MCPLCAALVLTTEHTVRAISLGQPSRSSGISIVLETGHPLPKNPTVFAKPAPAVADHNSDVPIPNFAQSQLDYEGELTIYIGKAGKDIKAEDALDHVAGYTVGNDVSARDWQTQPDLAGPRRE